MAKNRQYGPYFRRNDYWNEYVHTRKVCHNGAPLHSRSRFVSGIELVKRPSYPYKGCTLYSLDVVLRA